MLNLKTNSNIKLERVSKSIVKKILVFFAFSIFLSILPINASTEISTNNYELESTTNDSNEDYESKGIETKEDKKNNLKTGTITKAISGGLLGASSLGLASSASVATPALLTSIATTFGTASTGTAISTLSGAAANSAALAWLGGGALTAAGHGMAAGSALLAASSIAAPVLLSAATVATGTVVYLNNKEKINGISAKTENIIVDKATKAGNYLGNKATDTGKIIANNAIIAKDFVIDNTISAGGYLGNKAMDTGELIADNAMIAKDFVVDNTANAGTYLGNKATDTGELLADNAIIAKDYIVDKAKEPGVAKNVIINVGTSAAITGILYMVGPLLPPVPSLIEPLVGPSKSVPSLIKPLVAKFGKASTEIKISKLHGIAKTKAIASRIGGGSLATKGGGIAAGNAILETEQTVLKAASIGGVGLGVKSGINSIKDSNIGLKTKNYVVEKATDSKTFITEKTNKVINKFKN